MKYNYQNNFPKIHESVYIAPGAKLIGNIIAEENVSIWFNAVLRGDNDKIKIGKASNIQDNVTIHVDLGYPVNIESNVTVGHNAILHGCTVKRGAIIGMGSIILNGAVIKENSIVAAGSVVKENEQVEPNSIVAGVPATHKKALSHKSIEQQKENYQHYVDKGILYREEGH